LIFYLQKKGLELQISTPKKQSLSIGFCRALAWKNARSDRVFLELFGYFFFQEKK